MSQVALFYTTGKKVCLSGLRFERYFSHHQARWWEKYLSKCSPLKHTCSWHDKLIVLWILNRQAKISLCMGRKFLQVLMAPENQETLGKNGAAYFENTFASFRKDLWCLLVSLPQETQDLSYSVSLILIQWHVLLLFIS